MWCWGFGVGMMMMMMLYEPWGTGGNGSESILLCRTAEK